MFGPGDSEAWSKKPDAATRNVYTRSVKGLVDAATAGAAKVLPQLAAAERPSQLHLRQFLLRHAQQASQLAERGWAPPVAASRRVSG